MKVAFDLESFDDRKPVINCDAIRCMVECMAKINASIMRRTFVPSLYSSGVRYQQEEDGKETFRDCIGVLKRKRDDCNNLVAYRMGELIVRGIDTQVIVEYNKNTRGGYMFHVYLLNGHTPEDPSTVLGMRLR